MILKNLINFEKGGKLKKENFSFDYFVNRYRIAFERIKTAEKLLKNNTDDEGIYISAYSELYSAFRILCEVMLAICGYRTSSGPGHHDSAISTIWITLVGKEMNPVYLRLKKIGRKRNDMEYGCTFNISSIEMETMLDDVKLVLKKVRDEIINKKPANYVLKK